MIILLLLDLIDLNKNQGMVMEQKNTLNQQRSILN